MTTLTAREEDLIIASFSQISRMGAAATAQFYSHLFEVAPEIKPLFAHVDLDQQAKLLLDMLTMAVKSIAQLHKTYPDLESLGKRHAGYGVKPEHYAVFGEALIWTLENSLGEDFSAEAKAAWEKLYRILADRATR